MTGSGRAQLWVATIAAAVAFGAAAVPATIQLLGAEAAAPAPPAPTTVPAPATTQDQPTALDSSAAAGGRGGNSSDRRGERP